MLTYQLHATGSTGNSRAFISNLSDARRIEIELDVTAVGATPTITFTVQGLVPEGDTSVAADWIPLSLVQSDASVATSNAAIVMTTVSKQRRFVDGLDKRYFSAIAVESTANTNVTYQTKLKRVD